ncbi:MAG: hypothetical protein WBA88_09650, partial [Pseudaminobacter sp.]
PGTEFIVSAQTLENWSGEVKDLNRLVFLLRSNQFDVALRRMHGWTFADPWSPPTSEGAPLPR